MWGFLCTCSAQRGETQPLDEKSHLSYVNAQSTTTELRRDPDMRRNVPTAPVLAPQPKVGEEREHHAKNGVHILHERIIIS